MQAASTHVVTLMLRSADLELAVSTAAEQHVRLSSREAQADLTWRLGRLCAGVRSFNRWDFRYSLCERMPRSINRCVFASRK